MFNFFIFSWGDAVKFFEFSDKIVVGIISNFFTYFFNCKIVLIVEKESCANHFLFE